MKLDKKLDAWKQAGLIDADTAEGIRTFEAGSARPILLWAMGGVGALAIALGFVSIVAANWVNLSDYLKLGVAFAIGCVLAASIYRVLDSEAPNTDASHPANTQWLRDTLVIVFYGYTLAALALVGQIYQLGGTVGGLLLFWSLGTAGLVFLGRGRALAVFFFLGLLSTYHTNLFEWAETFRELDPAEKDLAENITVFLAGISPLLFLLFSHLLARIPALLRKRSHFAGVFNAGSWVLLALLGNAMQYLWYDDMRGDDVPRWSIWACLAAGGVVAGFIPKLYPGHSPRTQLGMRCTILAVYGMGVLGAGIDHPELPLVGALLNLGFLCLLAWTSLQVGSKAGFNFLTALIGLRVIAIYFEVFGSLLQTGLGLIGGGMLTLLITWIWLRKSNALATQLTEEADS